MYTELGPATLRHGERVTAARVDGPDEAWAERIERMLGHKGDPWNWQSSALLRRNTGVGAHFFFLHRDGCPFSSVAIIEQHGIGLLCHVWTAEADRQAGASSLLMAHALADFRRRGGGALYLGTEYGGTAWQYYRRRGFEPVAGRSGCMVLLAEPPEVFAAGWFAGRDTVVEPLDWPHWPAALPLFLEPAGGLIRLASTGLLGRMLAEEPLLPLLREQEDRVAGAAPPCAWVRRAQNGPAVLGLVSSLDHPLWPETRLLDLFCHATAWADATELVERLVADEPVGPRLVAYVDPGQPEKRAALERAGFTRVTHLPRWVKAPGNDARVDVTVLVRE